MMQVIIIQPEVAPFCAIPSYPAAEVPLVLDCWYLNQKGDLWNNTRFMPWRRTCWAAVLWISASCQSQHCHTVDEGVRNGLWALHATLWGKIMLEILEELLLVFCGSVSGSMCVSGEPWWGLNSLENSTCAFKGTVFLGELGLCQQCLLFLSKWNWTWSVWACCAPARASSSAEGMRSALDQGCAVSSAYLFPLSCLPFCFVSSPLPVWSEGWLCHHLCAVGDRGCLSRSWRRDQSLQGLSGLCEIIVQCRYWNTRGELRHGKWTGNQLF